MLCYFCFTGRHDLHLVRWLSPDKEGFNVVHTCNCAEPGCKATHLVSRRRLGRQPKTWVSNVNNTDPRREAMRDLVEEGWTYTQIGEKFGLSRERVGQLIGRRKDTNHIFLPGFWTTRRIAKSLNVNTREVRSWAAEIGARRGPVGFINVADIVQHYAELYMRPCRICGKPCEEWWAVSCPKHRKTQVPYDQWSASRKKKHMRLVNRWQERYPDRARIIQLRANLVYRLVHQEGMKREKAREVAKEEYPFAGS